MKILPKRGDTIKLSQISDLFWHTPTETVTNIVVVKKELTKTITVDDYPEMDSPIPSAQVSIPVMTWNALKRVLVSTRVVESVTDLVGMYSNQTLDGKRIYCEFKPTEVKTPADYFPSLLALNIEKDIRATTIISTGKATNTQILYTDASKVKYKTTLANPSSLYGTGVAVFGGQTEMIGAPVNRTITSGAKVKLEKVKTVEYQVNRSNGNDWGSNPPDAAHGAGNENLYFEYSIDGKTWIVLDTLAYNVTPASTWLTRTITLPAQARWKDGVYLRFRQPTTDGSTSKSLVSNRRDMWAVTSVRITDTDYGVIIDNDYAGAIGVTVNGKWVTYFDNGKIGLLTAPPEPTPLTLYKNGLVWNAGDTIGIVVDDEKKLLFFYRNNVLQYTHQYTANQNNQLKIFMVQGPGRSLSGGVNFGKDPFTYKEHFSALHKLTDHPFGSIQTTTTWTTENVPVTSVRDLTQFNAYKFNLSSFYGVVDDIPHKGIIKLSDFNSKYEPKFHIITFPIAGQYSYNIPPGCTEFETIMIGAGGGGGAGGITWQSPFSPFIKYRQDPAWIKVMNWYPNLAGGGGGGAGEVKDKITIKTYNSDTATIYVGAGGKGGVAPLKKDVFTKVNANGANGGNTAIKIGGSTVTAYGGKGGKFPGSWEYDYNHYISPIFNYTILESNMTYNEFVYVKANELTAGGLPGGSYSLSGSGQSGSSFRSYNIDNNFNWNWGNYHGNNTTITNSNNGISTFNSNQSPLIGIGGSGGGNKYFSGGKSGITSKLVKDWMLDVVGVNIVTGLITEKERTGSNGAGGSGGHSSDSHIDTKSWWWSSDDIFYDTKSVTSNLTGVGYTTSTSEFYSSGYIDIARNATLVISLYGAGGSGGDGGWVNGDPDGGGAGSYTVNKTLSAAAGDRITVNIGAGGAGVYYGSGRAGNAGGSTSLYRNGVLQYTVAGGSGGRRENGGGWGYSSPIGVGGRYNPGGNGGWGGLAAGGAGVDWYANGCKSGNGGNGYASVTYTYQPVSISAGTYYKPTGNISFNVGLFPVLRNFTPNNCSSPSSDLIFIGETVTQSKLVEIGIKTGINQLFVVKAGDRLNWKVTGQASGSLVIGWWHWANGNPTTSGVNYLVREVISSNKSFVDFSKSGSITIPDTFMADDVIVFGLGDNNTTAVQGVSFSVAANIAKLNLKEFQSDNTITSQSGASGGDGYVKITAWNFNQEVDANFIVPIGVTSLRFIVGTQSVVVNGLIANEFIFIKRSGTPGVHSYVTRDISDDIEGGVVTLVTGNTSGGMENIRIELV